MPNVGGQKYKILIEYQILMEYSDENHQLNAEQIRRLLAEKDVPSERKTIYKDMETLSEAGIDLIKGESGYYIGSRTFELPELKLLVDAVGASKFISEKKSKELLKKIESLTSKNQAKELSRQVIVPGRVKTNNEKIFYTIDVVYQCINENRQMIFQYEQWTSEKKKTLRHDGEEYIVSPAFLIRDDENYYLVAYDEKSEEIHHYRVDKIVNAEVSEIERGGKEAREAINLEEYSKTNINMFSGSANTLTIRCEEKLIGAIIDRFGMDTSIRPDGEGFIKARISVAVSEMLYGWLTGIGAIIVAPEKEAENYKNYLKKQLEKYGE